MKLQLALDLIDIPSAKRLLEKIIDLIDIVEIGTPFILKEGIGAVTEIKTVWPEKEVIADLKIMDAGDHEARIGFNAGADIITVLGVSHDSTIHRALDVARDIGKKVLIDLIAVKEVKKRTQKLDQVGAHFICIHTATDIQDQDLETFHDIQQAHAVLKKTKLAVAGGITPENLPLISVYHPEIVVVGGYITSHPDPRKAVLAIRKELDN